MCLWIGKIKDKLRQIPKLKLWEMQKLIQGRILTEASKKPKGRKAQE